MFPHTQFRSIEICIYYSHRYKLYLNSPFYISLIIESALREFSRILALISVKFVKIKFPVQIRINLTLDFVVTLTMFLMIMRR